MRFYELTKYKKIYSSTYWGAFDTESNDLINANIIENRNYFIEENNIKRKIKQNYLPRYILEFIDTLPKQFIDHVEVYKNEDKKIIIITSPYVYNDIPPQPFEQIYNLYTTNSKTFMCSLYPEDIKFLVKGYK